MQITEELQKTFNAAYDEAVKRRHEFLTLEHLLYALLHERTGSRVIAACGGNVDVLRRELDDFMKTSMETLPSDLSKGPEQTAALQRVLARAFMQAESSGQVTIDGGNVIAAIYQERQSQSTFLLESQGVTRLDVLNYISHGISKSGAPSPEDDAAKVSGFG